MGVFHECYELTSIKGIEDWDTSNVTDMGGTFRECKPLKTLDLSRWNVSKVESMNRMFNQCGSLETVGDLSNWITPVLTDATYMFNNTKIKSLKLTNFDTSNVTSAAHIFNCGADLEEYDIVITFGDNDYMPFNDFAFCSSIKYITIKGVPDVTRMISFVGILKDQTDTGAILDISQLSDEIKNSLMANTTLVNNAAAKGWTFKQYSLDDLEYFNIFEIEANNTNGMSVTLYENPDKIGEATTYTTDWGDGTADNNTSHTYSATGTYVIKTKLQSSDSSSKNYNITKCLNIRNDITNMFGFFYNFALLTEIPELPSGITSLRDTFFGCTSFNQQVNIPSTVTLTNGTFFECESFNQPVVIPDGVETLNGTLYGCTNFNSFINFGSGVKILDNTLYGCTSFNQSVTIPNSVTDILYLFFGCTSYSSTITFDVLSDSDLNLSNIFTNSTVNNIKFTGELSNTLMTDMLSELVNPTTIDIRELSEDNTNSIVNDSGIMNAVNTGINGTSHTLLYKVIEN